jgi:hypothetical protein
LKFYKPRLSLKSRTWKLTYRLPLNREMFFKIRLMLYRLKLIDLTPSLTTWELNMLPTRRDMLMLNNHMRLRLLTITRNYKSLKKPKSSLMKNS